MAAERRFRIMNVFTIDGDRMSGNPLCVFEDGVGLEDLEMLALARQMNLSETTFIFPSETATARVRIFTPTFEMPFAGHPTLGTAHVVKDMHGAGDDIVLEMKAGHVEVGHREGAWTLKAARPPEARVPDASDALLAQMIGLEANAIASRPLWIDTGAEQLMIQVHTADEVRRARPRAELLAKHGFSEKRGASMAYVFAKCGVEEMVARFFFLVHGGVVEDPATGSACANLGGYLLESGHAPPFRFHVRQGEAVARPSALGLRVDEAKDVYVSGEVIELGRGSIRL